MRLPLAVTLLLSACSGADTTTTTARATAPLAPTVRDSAGVEIAEHPADALERAPLITMADEPELTVGGEGSELELMRGNVPLALRDGRLGIFAEGSVHIVAGDGSIERIGRSGSGPGEFRGGQLSLGRGDTILVADDGESRISYVVPGAGVTRTRRFVPYSQDGIFLPAGGLGGDTVIVATAGFALITGLTGPKEVPWIVARLDPGSESLERVDSIVGIVLVPARRGSRVRAYEGTPAAVVTGDAVVTTSGRMWLLRVVRPDGTLARLVRVAVPRRVPDPAMVAIDADSQVARFRSMLQENGSGRMSDTAEMFAEIRGQVVADSIGAISALYRAPNDVLWVKDGSYRLADTTWAYTAVRPDGTILGRLLGRGPDRVVGFGPDRVVLRDEDDNGFVTMRVHRLNGLR